MQLCFSGPGLLSGRGLVRCGDPKPFINEPATARRQITVTSKTLCFEVYRLGKTRGGKCGGMWDPAPFRVAPHHAWPK